MHKEKLSRKKKEIALENKENQKPNTNIINGSQVKNKNLDLLKIQIEAKSKIAENDFINSEKNLNLNSRDRNFNVNMKGIENGFEGK